jgi:hypothetical protein
MPTQSEAGGCHVHAAAHNGNPPGAPRGDGPAVAGETGLTQHEAGLLAARRKHPTLADLVLLVAVALVIALSWRGLPDTGASPGFSDLAHKAMTRQLETPHGVAQGRTRTAP